MSNQRAVSSADAKIDWKFTVAEGGFVSRYGVAGGFFYKQFLPVGFVIPEQHPPKRISERTYRMAERRAAKAG